MDKLAERRMNLAKIANASIELVQASWGEVEGFRLPDGRVCTTLMFDGKEDYLYELIGLEPLDYKTSKLHAFANQSEQIIKNIIAKAKDAPVKKTVKVEIAEPVIEPAKPVKEVIAVEEPVKAVPKRRRAEDVFKTTPVEDQPYVVLTKKRRSVVGKPIPPSDDEQLSFDSFIA